MSSKYRAGRSYGQTRRYIDEIVDRRTQEMLSAANAAKRIPREADPAKVAERKTMLAQKGLLVFLERGAKCPVVLMGKAIGIATGITAEGFVIVEGWNDPFSPAVVQKHGPSGTQT